MNRPQERTKSLRSLTTDEFLLTYRELGTSKMAKKFNVSANTVKNYRALHGITGNVESNQLRYDNDFRRCAVEAFNKRTVPVLIFCEKWGVSDKALKRWVKKFA